VCAVVVSEKVGYRYGNFTLFLHIFDTSINMVLYYSPILPRTNRTQRYFGIMLAEDGSDGCASMRMIVLVLVCIQTAGYV
jgi:hypothetical protein